MCIIDTLLHFVIGCFNSLNLNLIRNLSIILIVKSMNTSIMWPCCYYLFSIICAPTVSTRDDCVSYPTYLPFSQRYQHSIFDFEIFIHRIFIFWFILIYCCYVSIFSILVIFTYEVITTILVCQKQISCAFIHSTPTLWLYQHDSYHFFT